MVGGKNVCGAAVAAFLVAAACGAGLAMAGPGQANTRDGCTGQDCRVRTVTPACRAFASFEACSSARVGRVACDGDAGVLRVCDGAAWTAMGGIGSSASLWVDAGVVDGVGVIQPVAALARSDGGVVRVERMFVGDVKASGTSVLNGGAAVTLDTGTWLGWSDTEPARASPPSFGISQPVGGSSLSIRGGTFGAQLYDGAGAYGANVRLETTRFASAATSGACGVTLSNGGRLGLYGGGCASVYLDSDGTNVRTGAPLLINTTNSAAISRSPRTTLVHDGGTVAAHSIYSQTVTLTGATAGAECAAGYGFQPAGMVITCQCGDANTVTAHFINVTAGGLTPGTGPVALRCFNP